MYKQSFLIRSKENGSNQNIAFWVEPVPKENGLNRLWKALE